MSDDEDQGLSGRGAADEEYSLPKATVAKLISDLLPSDISCAKDTKDLMAACCVEFIHLLSSEANEASEKDAKKTIGPEHVVAALKSLGFDEYVEEVEGCLGEHKEHQKVRATKQSASASKNSGHTQEELLAMQEALFAKSRAAAASGSAPAP